MDYEKLFPGRFIKSADFDGKDVTLVIAGVRAESIGEDKAKAIMTFEHARKELVLNRTNAEAIKLMFGRETNGWVGKRVTFYPAVIADPFGDGEISAIRVRGSPELEKPMSATIQRGQGKRSKTIKVAVRPTGKPTPKQNGKTAAKARVIDVQPGRSEEEAEAEQQDVFGESEPGSQG